MAIPPSGVAFSNHKIGCDQNPNAASLYHVLITLASSVTTNPVPFPNYNIRCSDALDQFNLLNLFTAKAGHTLRNFSKSHVFLRYYIIF